MSRGEAEQYIASSWVKNVSSIHNEISATDDELFVDDDVVYNALRCDMEEFGLVGKSLVLQK